MKTVTRTFSTLALTASALFASGCMPRSTESNEVGVRYCKFWCTGEKTEVIPPGQTAFLIPFKDDWYTLNIAMQNLYMAKEGQKTSEGQSSGRDDLVFKTQEGNDIEQDLVLTWKLDYRDASKVVGTVGTELAAISEKYVRPIARSLVRDFLNELTSNQFYESQERFIKAQQATQELKRRFSQYGIIIDQVNLRDYRFKDPQYQSAINDAKNAGQDRQKFEGEIKSQRAHWAKMLETERGESSKKIAEAEGHLNQTKLGSDAELFKKQQEARSIKTEKESQATSIRKMRAAMASAGGNTAVLMEYVKNFNPDEIVILPCDDAGGVSVNKLNLNDIISAEAAQQGTGQ